MHFHGFDRGLFRGLLAGTAIAALMAPQAASAQAAADPAGPSPVPDVPAQTEQPSAAQAAVGEIVVTAQRRSENIQKVPISVTAVSSDDARRLAIVETKNLQFVTPGLSFPEDNGTINPYIRGRGTNFSGPGLEGSIAIYIDDVYLQTQFGSSGLVDVSQLQVLKGPQGTLYGRNATGGAIVINTNNPTHQFEGHVTAGYGSFSTRRAEGVLNLPISSTLAVRFAGGYDERNGFVRNVVDNAKHGATSRYQFHAKALWEPTSNFSVLLKGEYQHSRGDYLRSQVIDGTNTPTGLGFYETQQSPVVPKALGGENNINVRAGSIRLNYNGEKFSINNITGYRHTTLTSCSDNDNIYERNFDFCPQLPGTVAAVGVTTIPNRLDPNAPATIADAYDNTLTTETRLTSKLGGPFNFLLGATYQKSKARFAAALTGTAFVGPGYSFLPIFDNFINATSKAVYGEAYFNFTSRLKLTAGGRLSKDTKTIQIYNNRDLAALGIPLAFLPPSVNQRASFNSFTPRVVLAYDTGPANYYLSYSGGFKSGGFNAPAIFPQTPLRPEKIRGLEAGAKLRFLDRRLSLDLAAFLTKSKDIQVAAIDTATGSVVQQNAATAKAYGFEANFRFRANNQLSLQAGGGYLHSRFTSFPNASVFAASFNRGFGQTTLNPFVEDLRGRPTPLSPALTMNGSVTYQFGLPSDWKSSVTLSGRYSSRYDFQAGAGGPERYAQQKAFSVINLTGDISPPDDRLMLSWYVSNVFQQHYYDQLQTNAQTGTHANGGGVYGVQALPRTVGGSLRVNF